MNLIATIPWKTNQPTSNWLSDGEDNTKLINIVILMTNNARYDKSDLIDAE